MLQDKLKINDAKTELLLIGTRPQLEKVDIDSIKIGDSVITPTKDAVWEVGLTRHFPCSPMLTKHVRLAITISTI